MRGVGSARWAVALSAAAWVVATACLGYSVVLDERLRDAGHGDLVSFSTEAWIVVAGIVAGLVVGSALATRQPRHPVGWLFLGLGVAMAVTAPLDSYARQGLPAGEATTATRVAAYVGDGMFLWWLLLVAAALQLTPDGRPLGRRWGAVLVTTVAGATAAFTAGIAWDGPLDAPFERVTNPWAASGAAASIVAAARDLGALSTGIGLIVAAASVVVRWRRATGDERRRLHWFALAAAPVVLFVPAAFVAAWLERPAVLLVATGGFVVVVPVAAGLAISRFHLYDVERILSQAFTWLLLTAAVSATYAGVVVATGRAVAGDGDSPVLAAVLGTLGAVSVAAPLRARIQDRLDRRFNRRRHEALSVVREHLARPTASTAIEAVLRRALGDDQLQVAYAVGEPPAWVDGTGHDVEAVVDPDRAVTIERGGAAIARLHAGAGAAADAELLRTVGEAAAAELDNARLRAEISLQLVEVRASRARIAAAQVAERRAIERNLHDGAQQRLLALAFDLRAAGLNGDPERLRTAVAEGAQQAHEAVLELRALANGLHPAALADGGLAGAIEDLGRRSPIPIEAAVPEVRLPVELEAAAWYVVCEAVTNAHKHAGAEWITIDADVADGWLRLEIRDDGCGGADPGGSGLRGIADRVAAAGGELRVHSDAAGTVVEGRFPCRS